MRIYEFFKPRSINYAKSWFLMKKHPVSFGKK